MLRMLRLRGGARVVATLRPLSLLLCLSLFAASPSGIRAQDPVTSPPLNEEMPVLPEVVVPGRPDAFPAAPLTDEAVVTPERGVSLSQQSGSSVTVIRSDELQAQGQSTVLEALRTIPGVQVVQSGGPGRPTSVFLRGANSEHTKVLLDGIPLNNPADPTRRFDFSTLSLDNIERIEIVRGPQSVAYGSDAIGGVIQIVTKRGDGPLAGRVTAQGGSFRTHEERLSVSGGDETRYYSLAASFFETQGFTAVSSRFGATEDDGYRNGTVSGRFGWNPTADVNVDYVFRYLDADVDVDGFDNFTFLPADVLGRQNLLNQFYQRIQLQSFALDGLIENRFGFSLTDARTADTDPGAFGQPLFKGQGRQVDWQSNLQLTETNVFTAGVDYFGEDASPFNCGTQSQNLLSGYLQDRWEWLEISNTSVGVRWDDHSVAGTAQTYRLAQSLELVPGGRLHASLGRGFRAPAISQRFGGVGNPNLRPEFSKGWDVGVEQEWWDGLLTTDVTYFRNDFDDLIVFVAGPFGPLGFGELRNVQAARSSGVELSGSSQLTERLFVSVTYTYTDTLDLNANQDLLRRPRNKIGFQADLAATERTRAHFTVLHVGERLDFDAFGGLVELAPYWTINVALSHRLSDRWELIARGDNLTDEDYEEVFAFSTAGISGYAGAHYSF